MVDPNDGAPPESRPPQLADLLSLCRSLNRETVRYVVVGGMAMIQAGSCAPPKTSISWSMRIGTI